MNRFRLKRVSENPDVTLGVLINEATGIPTCLTLENPFLWNNRNISSIPNGAYTCQHYSSERYTDCYIVTNVPNRSSILFHIGNTQKDTEGCILPGMKYGFIDGKPAVLDSKEAMNLLRRTIGKERFVLIVE
jgi:hypothetical protein